MLGGFVAVLISYSGPLAIFFQAAQSAEISSAMMTSWVWAISLGAAVSGIGLSLWLKVPVVTAWSAPRCSALRRWRSKTSAPSTWTSKMPPVPGTSSTLSIARS